MERLAQELEHLKRTFRHRSLELRRGVDFTSNDYLGLSRHPALREAIVESLDVAAGVGAAGSRLLRGHQAGHAELERFAAQFFASEKALYFSTGFLANYALFTGLPGRHDTIVFDDLVHASVKEGIHASHARRSKARHNDVNAFEDACRRARARGAKQLWLAVESVYSMDGDVAPIDDLLALARAYEAVLIVDEAHATGILGPNGRGLAEGRHDQPIITLHTCGKGLGVAGALICGHTTIVDYLVNTSRPFIYSTAPPEIVAIAVKRALQLIDEEPWRRSRLGELSEIARQTLRGIGGANVPVTATTQILPVVIGSEERALEVAARCQAAGFDVRAIRPPTVPAGTSRLRVAISVDRTPDEISGLGHALSDALHQEAA